MKREFVTVYGKAIIENNKLYIKNVDIPFSKTALAHVAYNLSFILVFVMQFFRDPGPKFYVSILVWGVISAFRLPSIYDALFKRSYAATIPLNAIKSVKTEEDSYGLQVFIILNLANNRYRKISFRKLENEYQRFVQTISPKKDLVAYA